jgi:hypothetical protein
MEVWLRIHDGRVAAVSFVTDGCGSSRACGSMAATLAEGKRIAGDMHVPFLGSLPLDSGIAAACDRGRAFLDYCSTSATAALLRKIIEPIVALDETPQAVHYGGSLDVS